MNIALDIDETELTQRLRKQLIAMGAKVFKIHGHNMQERGIPDMYIAYQGMQSWVEIKVANRAVEPHQRDHIIALNRAGAHAFVLRYVNPVLLFQNENGETIHKIGVTALTRLADVFLNGYLFVYALRTQSESSISHQQR